MTLVIAPTIIPPGQMPKYIALMSTVFALASVVGPLMGGAISESGQWKWVFLFKYVSLLGWPTFDNSCADLDVDEKCPSRFFGQRSHHLHSAFRFKPKFTIIQQRGWSKKAVLGESATYRLYRCRIATCRVGLARLCFRKCWDRL